MNDLIQSATMTLSSTITHIPSSTLTTIIVGFTGVVMVTMFGVYRKRKHVKPYRSGLHREANLAKMQDLRQSIKKLENGSILVRPCEGVHASDDENMIQYGETKPGSFIWTSRTDRARIDRSRRGVAKAPAITVTALFHKAAKRCPQANALVSCTGKHWTWSMYWTEARRVAKSLIKLGMRRGDAINILGFNSPEWLLLNVGAIVGSGMAAGVYTSNGAEACWYLASHSKAVVIGVENEEQLKKYTTVVNKLPDLKAFVVWAPTTGTTKDALGKLVPGFKVMLWDEFLTFGTDVEDAVLDTRIEAQDPGESCTLIYTSGTTGNPKAVQCSHDNVVWNALTTWSSMSGDDDLSDEPGGLRHLSFLPLSHIAGQMIDIHAPMFCSAQLENSCATHFADANALKGSLLQSLIKTRPTHFFGVPRVWEKFQAAMVAKGKSNSALKKFIVGWARAKGLQYYYNMQNGRSHKKPFLWGVAKKILFAARQAIGLDKCRVCLSGAAAINTSTLEFFGSLNIPIQELYGMSESTGPTTYSHMGGNGLVIGSCGAPMAGTELMIEHVPSRDKPGQGEICFRGRHRMMGYLDDDKKSKECIDELGWIHSGDVGTVDEDGMVFIVGRIKELLIGSGGENIAPVPVEEFIKQSLPAVSNVVMIGDKRKYFVALVTPKVKPNEDGSMSKVLDGDATKIDPACKTADDVVSSSIWKAYVQAGIDTYNKEKAVSGAAKIAKFALLNCDFSPMLELGPTLKLKRNVVNEVHARAIEALYPPGE